MVLQIQPPLSVECDLNSTLKRILNICISLVLNASFREKGVRK